MNFLLLFFAIPIAVIIFSIALEKILKCPILVASVIFAILLIIAFTMCDATFLVAVIIYTIIAFITATIVRFICLLFRRGGNILRCICRDHERDNNDNDDNNNNNNNDNDNNNRVIRANEIRANTISANTVNTNRINTREGIRRTGGCNCCRR